MTLNPMVNKMKPVNIIGVTRAVSSDDKNEARDLLDVGVHEVDVTVRIHGTLNVAKDTTERPTTSLPLKAVIALILHYSGITGDHAAQIIKQAMKTALKPNEDRIADEIMRQRIPEIDVWERELLDPIIESLPRRPKKGAVTGRLIVEEISSSSNEVIAITKIEKVKPKKRIKYQHPTLFA